MEIIGVDPKNEEAKKKMQKSAAPLYVIQFLLTLFQVLVLAHLIADTTKVTGLERALWIWAAFIIPTLAGAVMWTNQSRKLKWSQFLIQGGYQLILFTVLGLLIQFWK
jgi:predicted ABC-type exoprotein transport system permease subunit